jgi:hypothetical protein
MRDGLVLANQKATRGWPGGFCRAFWDAYYAHQLIKLNSCATREVEVHGVADNTCGDRVRRHDGTPKWLERRWKVLCHEKLTSWCLRKPTASLDLLNAWKSPLSLQMHYIDSYFMRCGDTSPSALSAVGTSRELFDATGIATIVARMKLLGRVSGPVQLLVGNFEFARHHPLLKCLCCSPCWERVGNQGGITNWFQKIIRSQRLGGKNRLFHLCSFGIPLVLFSRLLTHFLDPSLVVF